MTSNVTKLRGYGAAMVVAGSILAPSFRPSPASGPARQASWPTKTVRIIVPFAPGSATDLVPRAVFEQVQQQVGQTFVIENRPGGGTTTGTAAVAKSDPDGYTMLVHSNGFVTTPASPERTCPTTRSGISRAITPLAAVPMVLVISPEKKIKTLQGAGGLRQGKTRASSTMPRPVSARRRT